MTATPAPTGILDAASVPANFVAGYEVSRLPVCLPARPDRVVGLVSQGALMKRYHRALSEA